MLGVDDWSDLQTPASGQALAGFVGEAWHQAPFISASFNNSANGITAVDVVSFAKGGSGGGGGGSSGGGGTVTTWTIGGDVAGYDIRIDFKGTGWTTELMAPFKIMADYLTTIITADINNGGSAVFRGISFDDLYVTAELKFIDGVGGILGQAGPTAVWTANELTAAGQMQFDFADVGTYVIAGTWDEIVAHEFMHVLGFGSLWNYGDDPLVTTGQYWGEAGVAAYDAIDGILYDDTYIPVETEGGSGTAGAHWDEDALKNELMTGIIGYLKTDGTYDALNNYLSKFSVMSLADLGYAVDYAAWTPLRTDDNPWSNYVAPV